MGGSARDQWLGWNHFSFKLPLIFTIWRAARRKPAVKVATRRAYAAPLAKCWIFKKCSAWALVFAAVGIPACDRSIPKEDKSRSATKSDISFPLDDFTLTERSGAKLSKDDLRGKVWIASFVFTRCTGPCPQVTATVARLQSELAQEKDVRFVTFTVDPGRDHPAELRKYAEHFRADKERWLFLTGEEKELHRLLKEGFKVPIYRNSATKEVGKEFDHSSRLVVVDRHGTVRGYFDGFANVEMENSEDQFEKGLKRLKARVAELLKED